MSSKVQWLNGHRTISIMLLTESYIAECHYESGDYVKSLTQLVRPIDLLQISLTLSLPYGIMLALMSRLATLLKYTRRPREYSC